MIDRAPRSAVLALVVARHRSGRRRRRARPRRPDLDVMRMTWVVIAVLLVAWLAGLLLVRNPLVNLLLVAAAVLLVAEVIREREAR